MAKTASAHKPTAREHTTMTGFLTHHVGHANVHKPVKGAHTKSDREPMSTSEYKGHLGKYEGQKNGRGKQ